MAVAPKPRRHWFRYSLRTAGVVLTLFCLWLGWLANRAREQPLATERLRSIGAHVKYDRRPEQVPVPTWIRNRLGDDYFVNVVEAVLNDYVVNRKCNSLTPEQFDLAVSAMQRLPRLNKISFNYTGIRDEDLQRFAPLGSQIEVLYFNESFPGRLRGDSIRHLSQWHRLRELSIDCFALDSAFLTHVQKIPALKILRWSHEVDKDGLAAIAKCQHLEQLSFFLCRIDGSSLLVLRSAKRLKRLSFHNCSFQFAGPISVDGVEIEAPRLQKDSPPNGIKLSRNRFGG